MGKICVSAPGKALIVGGYLVLINPNVGLTISTTARFYTFIELKKTDSISNINNKQYKNHLNIFVDCPQFHVSYTYMYNIEKNEFVTEVNKTNPFIEKCISIVFSFIREYFQHDKFSELLNEYIFTGNTLFIKLQADNDFYSQIDQLKSLGLPLISDSLQQLPRFSNCPLDKYNNVKVSKTGLGSSAALTTSLVAGLLSWFRVIDLKKNSDLDTLHNISQLVHSIAQGKIGSGFDVSAAIFGSQIYTRFSSENFASFMDQTLSSKLLYNSVMNQNLWTQTIEKFAFPPHIDIVMGDICAGSGSVSMAKQVLSWLSQATPNEKNIWDSLAESNKLVISLLNQINEESKNKTQSYTEFLIWAKDYPVNSWEKYSSEDKTIRNLFIDLYKEFYNCRCKLREIGTLANVDIEPPQQTALLDATMSIPGVLFAFVPGAGGYDAIFSLVISIDTRRNVEQLWSTWRYHHCNSWNIDVCPLLLKAESVNEGIRLEETIE